MHAWSRKKAEAGSVAHVNNITHRPERIERTLLLEAVAEFISLDRSSVTVLRTHASTIKRSASLLSLSLSARSLPPCTSAMHAQAREASLSP